MLLPREEGHYNFLIFLFFVFDKYKDCWGVFCSRATEEVGVIFFVVRRGFRYFGKPI